MDPVSLARTARESLARGLAALQSPGVPPQILAAADPVAHAMSALHRVETTSGAGLAEAAPAALAFARQALAMLQAQSFAHPAIDQGMEAIASSLGVVHQLTQLLRAPAAEQSQIQPARLENNPAHQPHSHARQSPAEPPQQMPPTRGKQAGRPPVSAFAGTLLETPVSAEAGPARVPPKTQPSVSHPSADRQEARPHPSVALESNVQAAGIVAGQAGTENWDRPPPQPGQGSTLASAGQPGGVQRIEAALGAHSVTNFYKGLSGNDVIESGGIFIATYQVPNIGSKILLHVSLPGGFEFEAAGVVRWTREAPDSGNDTPPGFGAQFTQISPEGRQLVYRYVRNREPLFHDDF